MLAPRSSPMIGFIPAGAGNGQAKGADQASAPVHPRGCGERAKPLSNGRKKNGSSPRVRGTVYDCPHSTHADRFIPAGAGNGLKWQRSMWQRAVHPRGCGERATKRTKLGLSWGSSPRVRGTGARQKAAALCVRLIPAGAGNGRSSCLQSSYRSVHPRGCGERVTLKTGNNTSIGSSPRVRGTGGRSCCVCA